MSDLLKNIEEVSDTTLNLDQLHQLGQATANYSVLKNRPYPLQRQQRGKMRRLVSCGKESMLATWDGRSKKILPCRSGPYLLFVVQVGLLGAGLYCVYYMIKLDIYILSPCHINFLLFRRNP